jgi:RecA/RadA recombinase
MGKKKARKADKRKKAKAPKRPEKVGHAKGGSTVMSLSSDEGTTGVALPTPPPRKQLIRYFTAAAEMLGRAAPKDDSSGDASQRSDDSFAEEPPTPAQAGYSLLWYYQHELMADLDSANPSRYCEVLDAFLGADVPSVLSPTPIPEADVAEEERQIGELFPNSGNPLNACQVEALHKALHYPLSLIQGPPGTGKTETILRIAAMAAARGESVAIVSGNNAAVANVQQKLADELRAAREDSTLADPKTNLAYAAARGMARLGAAKVRADAEDPWDHRGLHFVKGKHTFPDGEEVGGWEQDKRLSDFTATYPIVTSTVHSLKKCFIDGAERKYDLLIMDEASQTTLVMGIVALSCAHRIVVVGDEKQLPPVFTPDDEREMRDYADKKGLFAGTIRSPYDMSRKELSFLDSCYEVFSNRNPELKTMLRDHYRCEPAIIDFCNEEVYDGMLRVHPHEHPATFPIEVSWYEGDYRERALPKRDDKDDDALAYEDEPEKKHRSSYVNQKQLTILKREQMDHIKELVRAGKSVCMLSPYRAQVGRLEGLVRNCLGDVIEQSAIDVERADGDEGEVAGRDDVIALTIHRSQGREYDAVYLLPVEDGDWEWPWSQGRRLVNVAVSRAKGELHVICSTKLMGADLRARLGVDEPYIKHKAELDDDLEKKQLFVRRLIEYACDEFDKLPAEKRAQVLSEGFGVHRSSVRSIFDEIPFKQGSDKSAKDSAPERCMRDALADMRLGHDIRVAREVRFDQLLMPDGTRVSERCAEEYECPDAAHFDFVLYDRPTRRVVAVMEVDGAQHRLLYKKGQVILTQHEADERKDRIVHECGGDLAVLAWARGLQLKGFHPGKVAEGVDGGVKDELPDQPVERLAWAMYSSKLDPSAGFVLIRVPSDGSTCYETEALRARLQDEGVEVPAWASKLPTVEEMVRRQVANMRRQGDAWRGLTVVPAVGGEPLLTKVAQRSTAPRQSRDVSPEKPLSLTACINAWRGDPAKRATLTPEQVARLDQLGAVGMNKVLLGHGFHKLEDGDSKRRTITEKGRKAGMVDATGQDEDGPYTYVLYSKQAQEYLWKNIKEFLG